MNAPVSEIQAVEDTKVEELDASNPTHFVALEKLQKLEESLLTRDPLMKGHLAEVHRHLIQHEELVHFLKPDQIALIIKGAEIQANVSLAAAVSKKSTSKSETAKLKGLSVDDF